MEKIIKKTIVQVVVGFFAVCCCSCQNFLEVEPRSFLNRLNVYQSEATAEAAMVGLYAQLALDGFASGNENSLSFLAGLSSDELENTGTGYSFDLYRQFNENVLVPTNSKVDKLWRQPYQIIYGANAIIEGISGGSALSQKLKDRLRGEALFLRAFSHFYLVNLFGGCPLVLTTDYRLNAELPKADISKVYEQVIRDLNEAQHLLPADYSFARNERIRANKWVAKALLARVYLYIGQWTKAEKTATEVIDQDGLFQLENLEEVFLKDSREAIWQLVPRSGDNEINANEARVFTFDGKPDRAALREAIVTDMESDDDRREHWIGITSDGGKIYYFSAKYDGLELTPVVEYSIILRLAELYLIRAEARVHQGNIAYAMDDLNQIRQRAGLGARTETSLGLTSEEALEYIYQERKIEFMTEWGHRWFDLKRTGKSNEVLGALKPTWQPTATLYPIPESQLLNNPGMTDGQNPGYTSSLN